MAALKHIDIIWEEPIAIQYDRESDTYKAPDLHPSIAVCGGVYQIYGNHPVYGKQVLLYIGQSSSTETGQTLFKRLRKQLSGRFWYHTGLIVHVGTIQHRSKYLDDEEMVKDVESLLIAANAPALNRQHIDWPRATAKNLLIVNRGFIGSIVPECSGYAYCK